MSDVKLRLRWFPGRSGVSLADAGDLSLTVSASPIPPVTGPMAWECRGPGVNATFRGSRQEAQAHLEGLVRDRLIKALAAFGEGQ